MKKIISLIGDFFEQPCYFNSLFVSVFAPFNSIRKNILSVFKSFLRLFEKLRIVNLFSSGQSSKSFEPNINSYSGGFVHNGFNRDCIINFYENRSKVFTRRKSSDSDSFYFATKLFGQDSLNVFNFWNRNCAAIPINFSE